MLEMLGFKAFKQTKKTRLHKGYWRNQASRKKEPSENLSSSKENTETKFCTAF